MVLIVVAVAGLLETKSVKNVPQKEACSAQTTTNVTVMIAWRPKYGNAPVARNYIVPNAMVLYVALCAGHPPYANSA